MNFYNRLFRYCSVDILLDLAHNGTLGSFKNTSSERCTTLPEMCNHCMQNGYINIHMVKCKHTFANVQIYACVSFVFSRARYSFLITCALEHLPVHKTHTSCPTYYTNFFVSLLHSIFNVRYPVCLFCYCTPQSSF